jgi:hypothetical protein
MKHLIHFLLISSLIMISTGSNAQENPAQDLLELNNPAASHFASLALHCIQKPFPYKPGHVIQDSTDNALPAMMHPAFYGCFDWHSSVHGHWMLVRLLKLFPDMDKAAEIRAALNANLTRENLDLEAVYFERAGTKSFERTYGWAWLLKLVEELEGWDDPDGKKWRANMAQLEETIVQRYLDFLPRQEYPIRTGEHPNTAFGLAFAWDYAYKAGNKTLLNLVEGRSRDYYMNDEIVLLPGSPAAQTFCLPAWRRPI